MKSSTALLALIVIVGAGVVFYGWQHSHAPESPPAPAAPLASESPVFQPLPSPSIHFPVSEESESEAQAATHSPLPSIDDSDASIQAALTDVFGKDAFDSLFIAKQLIRRIVVSVDNATGHKQPSPEYLPLKNLESHFAVSGKGDDLVIATSNSRRYTPYVNLVRALDMNKLVSVYSHFYPLFQSAYQDLGKPGYFNDRLVAVIENIMAAPEVSTPIRLVRPSKHSKYKFADEMLEDLPSGQKILVRMGSENAHIVKEKLKQLRGMLIHLGKTRKPEKKRDK